ncbi:MAG: hypothetical protein OXC26_14355 [Albidovulum sp.]|nr:hypothetical protein [Albidovulum sp.]
MRYTLDKRLPELRLGHWEIENLKHRKQDCRLGEDACLTRTGNFPTSGAAFNYMDLAVIFHSRDRDK